MRFFVEYVISVFIFDKSNRKYAIIKNKIIFFILCDSFLSIYLFLFLIKAIGNKQ